MKSIFHYLPTAGALLLSACASVPPAGPSVMALPGGTSNFDQFRLDDGVCRQYALDAIGRREPAVAAAESAVNSAAVGAAVGAAAGAVIGAASDDPGGGAAVGAGAGLLAGSAAGAGAYQHVAREYQDRYDMAYVQCMYAKGHQVPLPAAAAPASATPPPPRPAAPPRALPPPPPPT